MDWLAFTLGFFAAAMSPGLNMLTALTIGISRGYKRAFLFILSSTFSLAAIVFLSGLGIGFLITRAPAFFDVLRVAGAIYLFFIAFKMWRGAGLEDTSGARVDLSRKAVVFQGFVSSFGDPVVWGFMVSSLPKFMDASDPLNGTFVAFIVIIAGIEFVATNIYATCGTAVRKFFASHAIALNRFAAVIFGVLGAWMLGEVVGWL